MNIRLEDFKHDKDGKFHCLVRGCDKCYCSGGDNAFEKHVKGGHGIVFFLRSLNGLRRKGKSLEEALQELQEKGEEKKKKKKKTKSLKKKKTKSLKRKRKKEKKPRKKPKNREEVWCSCGDNFENLKSLALHLREECSWDKKHKFGFWSQFKVGTKYIV